MLHRLIFTVLIAAVLGLVTTVAVAWGACLWQRPGQLAMRTHTGPPMWIEMASRTGGYEHVSLRVGAPMAVRPLPAGPGGPQRPAPRLPGQRWTPAEPSQVRVPAEVLPWWVSEADIPEGRAGARFTAAGWPMRCLRMDSFTEGVGTILGETDHRHAVRAPGWLDPGRTPMDGRLPARPILAGLAANAGIYGGAWWLLLFGGPLIWRNRRSARWKRRGLCIKCGYDLLGEYEKGCPECGWGRDRDTRASEEGGRRGASGTSIRGFY